MLHELLKHAKWMHEQTNGAFDPTIAPLVNLWGFGPVSRNRLRIPKEEEIHHALEQVGLSQLEILNGNRIRKKRPDLQIDLSASAKGEIIDQICRMLDGRGFNNYLVEIGGEIRARGNGKSGIGWTVGLEDGPRNQAEDGPPSICSTIQLPPPELTGNPSPIQIRPSLPLTCLTREPVDRSSIISLRSTSSLQPPATQMPWRPP